MPTKNYGYLDYGFNPGYSGKYWKYKTAAKLAWAFPREALNIATVAGSYYLHRKFQRNPKKWIRNTASTAVGATAIALGKRSRDVEPDNRNIKTKIDRTVIPAISNQIMPPTGMMDLEFVNRERTGTRNTPFLSMQRRAGLYRGSFGRPQRRGVDPFKQKGVVFKYETGGIFTDQQCVYLLHGTCPAGHMFNCFGRVIVKTLFTKAGYQVQNLLDESQIGNSAAVGIRYYYKSINSTIIQTRRVDFSATTTYETMNTALLNDINTAHTSDITMQFIRFELVEIPNTNHLYVRSSFDAENSYITVNCTGRLNIQNSTVASTTAGDPNADTSSDIENNPLIGMIYSHNTSNKNHIVLNGKDINNAQLNLIIGEGTGITTFNSGPTTNGNGQILRKPPNNPQTFGLTHVKPIRLHPGVIRQSHLNMQKTMKLNDFVKIYQRKFNAVAEVDDCKLGKVALIALEKVLNSRSTSEPLVTVAWQHQVDIKMVITSKRRTMTQALIEIQGLLPD